MNSDELYGSFTAEEYFYNACLLLIASLGFILCTFVTIGLAKSKTFNPSGIMVLSFIINGFLLCIYFIVILTANLIVGHFAFGQKSCEGILGSLFLGLEAAIFFNIIVMVLNLYLVIIHRIKTTLSMVRTQVVILWVSAIAVAAGGHVFNSNNQYVLKLNPSKTVCTINWADKHQETLVDIYIALGMITFFIAFVSFVYASIFWLYFKKNREVQNSWLFLTDNERKLFFRTSSICLCFFLFWSTYIVLIISELISSQRSTALFDAIAILSAGFFHLSTPMVIIFQDPNIRSEMYGMLGIKPQTMSTIETRIKSSFYQIPLYRSETESSDPEVTTFETPPLDIPASMFDSIQGNAVLITVNNDSSRN